jgi:hypothetical protein
VDESDTTLEASLQLQMPLLELRSIPGGIADRLDTWLQDRFEVREHLDQPEESTQAVLELQPCKTVREPYQLRACVLFGQFSNQRIRPVPHKRHSCRASTGSLRISKLSARPGTRDEYQVDVTNNFVVHQ